MRSCLFGRTRFFATVVFLIALLLATLPDTARAQHGGDDSTTGSYQKTILVSNQAGQAPTTDPNLVNAWGLVSSTAGPWWVSDERTGLSTLYNGQGQIVSLVVTIPTAAGSPAGTVGSPTGIVFNSGSNFVVSQNGVSGSSVFMFATGDGTISGWSPGVNRTNAILAVDRSRVGTGAVYRGLTLAQNGTGTFLYATNFRARTIEMFDGNFNLVRSFTDQAAAASCASSGQCYAPFGIQAVGGKLVVTFALQNNERTDDFGLAGSGKGFVDVFDTSGNLLRRLTSSDRLKAPWGIALAPANFGKFSNDLLIGNFDGGSINVFDPNTGALLGQLADSNGPIEIEGLWALEFGNGGAAGATNQLFFTAGPNHGRDGLFGFIQS